MRLLFILILLVERSSDCRTATAAQSPMAGAKSPGRDAADAWVDRPLRLCARRFMDSCDAGRELGVLDPVMALLSETRGGNHQDGAVCVMKDGVRDAAQHQRLHAAEAAGAQDDHAGVHIGGLGKGHSGDSVVSIHDPRLRDESGGGPLHASGGAALALVRRCSPPARPAPDA